MASILNVGRIAEGFVLDHIQAGKSMESDTVSFLCLMM